VVDLKKYKSHPHKELTVHTQGVIDKTKSLTTLKIAEIAAIFHDLGKLNLNFQDKLDGKKNSEYSNHAYLSAYAFLCFVQKNQDYLIKELGRDNFQNNLSSIISIIANHHGDLRDFEMIISIDECKRLFEFINKNPLIPSSDFLKYFATSINDFELSANDKIQNIFRDKISYRSTNNNLDHFLETQFAFASLIQADKTDAGDIELKLDKEKINQFCEIYEDRLSSYLNSLLPDSELNILRTQIRIDAITNILTELKSKNKRVFSLTAPTGAGKTLMLLSLANEIIQEKGDFRIIYSIPFLSITEQVEKECIKIFGEDWISRIDSKAENNQFNAVQKETDYNPLKAKELLNGKFVEDIFLNPFIITTFVRFFETIVSNRNSTLLKLPNFSKCIFLIDELQSLPPRLYTFFVAYLDAFCNKFDSYCIVSTATMPSFTIPTAKIELENPQLLFKDFIEPFEISDLKYFNHQLFNRYQITQEKVEITIEQLAQKVIEENNSVLVIVNTVDDSKDLHNVLSEFLEADESLLLNTHFTPNDRKIKIEIAKQRLNQNQKIILVSTQLIEAGVDIDFPVLYRDMATIPSIIQSAGRCNRNGKLKCKGKVVLINIINRDKNRAELIYRGDDKKILKKTKEYLHQDTYSENSLFEVQRRFFSFLGSELVFGEHIPAKPHNPINFTKHINELAYETIGQFRLIDNDVFGEEFRCYVPVDGNDNSFQELKELDDNFRNICSSQNQKKDFVKIMEAKNKIHNHLKKMSNQIVQIRLKKNDIKPLYVINYNDLYLINRDSYSNKLGLILTNDNLII